MVRSLYSNLIFLSKKIGDVPFFRDKNTFYIIQMDHKNPKYEGNIKNSKKSTILIS